MSSSLNLTWLRIIDLRETFSCNFKYFIPIALWSFNTKYKVEYYNKLLHNKAYCDLQQLIYI